MEMLRFQSFYFQLKNGFLKKFFVFQKIWFKVKVLPTFKIPTDCHIEICLSYYQRVILKISTLVFLEESILFLLASNCPAGSQRSEDVP